jgi:acyl dehydratase
MLMDRRTVARTAIRLSGGLANSKLVNCGALMNKSNESASSPRLIESVDELRDLVGQEVGVSNWFVVTQELVNHFADLTHDPQWIHTDPARAQRESPYGTTIAHGFLTLSLLSHLQRQAVQIRGDFSRAINYGFNRVRFPAAVPVGSRIRVHSTLAALDEIEGGFQIAWDLIVEIEGQQKPAAAAQWLVRLYR